jgi:hypothetical protein
MSLIIETDVDAENESKALYSSVISSGGFRSARNASRSMRRQDSMHSGFHADSSSHDGGHNKSQYGRSSTNSFASLSQSVTKIMDKKST